MWHPVPHTPSEAMKPYTMDPSTAYPVAPCLEVRLVSGRKWPFRLNLQSLLFIIRDKGQEFEVVLDQDRLNNPLIFVSNKPDP